MLLAAMLLGACGGGGGGGGSTQSGGVPPAPPVSTPAPVDNSWLQLTPSAIELSHYEGEPVSVTVNAKSTKTITQTFNVGVIDTSGTLEPEVSLNQVTPYEYNVRLRTAKTLKAGTHQTNIEVRLCEDNPLVCAKPISGSPWKLPLKVVVKPIVNLTPLAKLPQLGPWTTFQGNALHSGYVPIAVDPAKISRRWNLTLPGAYAYGGNLPSMAIDGGQVFFVTKDQAGDQGTWSLRAVDESTGKPVWNTPVGSGGSVNSPAVARGMVVMTADTESTGTLLTVEQKTGALVRKVALPSTQDNYLYRPHKPAPTPAGDNVFVSRGRSNGLAAYNLASGTLQWEQDWQVYGQDWTPAVEADRVYAAQAYGGFKAFDTATGAERMAIGAWNESRSFVVPVLSGTGMAFVVTDKESRTTLNAVDLGKQAIAWMTGNVEALPVTDGKTVYVLAAGSIEARDAKTGLLQWSVGIPAIASLSNLLLTDTLLFVSAGNPTYPRTTWAIDLVKREIVWTHPHGGTLAVSDRGVLYILQRGEATLQAINLQ